MAGRNNLTEQVVNLAKRRGFIFPSSEIYGGLASSFDFGPFGVLLKNNIKAAWWHDIVTRREEVFGLDSAILTNRKVLQASGHVDNFSDSLVECQKCHLRFRKDDIKGNPSTGRSRSAKELACPSCGGKLGKPKQFNLMFKTYVGPVEEQGALVYLRPETAQGIFVNFSNVLDTLHPKLPFGIAQIGKAFRNEITPGNFIFRTREFEQMELEYFVTPKDADGWFKYWQEARLKWYLGLGFKKTNLRSRSHAKSELAHYAKAAVDLEYNFPFGWSELEGIANRGDFDLSSHEKESGKDLKYFDEEAKKKFLPYVIEPSAGVERTLFALLLNAYHEEEVKPSSAKASEGFKSEKRIVLKLDPRLAPVKAAVLPLVRKAPLVKVARSIFEELAELWPVDYDEVTSIGKRYRRQDEIGTPFCLTIDFESLDDKKVTVRDRDTMKQKRVKIKELKNFLADKIGKGQLV